MERVREANKILKIYPKLKLGEKVIKEDGKPGGVRSTGLHKIKITAEPSTTMVRKGDKTVKGFKFVVEEGGKLYKWLVPMTDAETGEGHYLMEHLQDIEVGEEFTVEMKKEQGRNFIEVKRPNAKDAPDDDLEEVHGDSATGEDDEGFQESIIA
jgi:hypothetical protein